MSLSAWFVLLWVLYSAVVVWLIVVQPSTKNPAVEQCSDDEVDVPWFSPR